METNKTGKIILIILPILLLVILFIFVGSEPNKEEENKENDIAAVEECVIEDSECSDDSNIDIKEESNKNKYKTISELVFEENSFVNYGKVVSSKEVRITPEIPGRVELVNVEVGDMVKKGDILIYMDISDEENSLRATELNSNISDLAYQKTTSIIRDEDLNIVKKDVELKQQIVEKTKKDTSRQLNDMRTSLDEILRKDIDDFFDHTDIDSEIYLPTYTYRISSENEIEKMEEKRKSLGFDFKSYYKYWNSKSFEEKLLETNEILNKFYELSDLLYLNSQDILSMGEQELEMLEIKTLAIKNKIDSKKIILENLDSACNSQKIAKEISELNLEKSEKGARGEDVEISRLNQDLANNSIKKILNLIAKKSIKAPMSGIISMKDVNVGENISSARAIISIVDKNNLKIKTSITTDLAKSLSIKKKVKVNSLDAEIILISPISDTFGLVDIEIKVLEKNDFEIGEFVKILIPEETKKDDKKIVLPLASIFEESGEYFIFVLDNLLVAEKKSVDFIKLSGDGIMVKNNFEDDERIIINARGISEKDKF